MAEGGGGALTLKDEVAAWDSAGEKLREVTKWIAAAFGALGALLIGTAPLSGLGRMEFLSLPFVLAAAAGVLALGSVAYIVWTATAFLAPSTVTSEDVKHHADLEALRKQVEADATSYLGTWGPSVGHFFEALDAEYRLLAAAGEKVVTTRDAAEKEQWRKAAKGLGARVEAMGKVSARLLAVARFHDLSKRFRTARTRMFRAAALTVLGISVFVVTVGSAGDSSGAATTIPARIVLTEEGQGTAGALLGESCAAPFRAVVLRGGASGPWEVLVTDPDCEPGTLTLAKTEARVLLVFDE